MNRSETLRILLSISALFIFFVSPANLHLFFTKPHRQVPFPAKTPHLHRHQHLQIAHSSCEGTLYPNLCVSTLASFPDLTSKSIAGIISAVVNLTLYEVWSADSNCSDLEKNLPELDPLDKQALHDCRELFQETIHEFNDIIAGLSSGNASKNFHDLQTLLSGAMTNQYTCLDGFAYSSTDVREKIEKGIINISRHVSNSLAMLKKIPAVEEPPSAAEVFPEYGRVKDGFPTWVTFNDRKLLQTAANTTKYDIVVAADGTGNFTNVTDAVAFAPNSSSTRYVIYIKAGAYFENVEIGSNKDNIMFVGDGVGKTVIKASRNVVDGSTTFRSATVAAVGTGFVAKGITFENSAGPTKHQAVAFRSSSDFSVFYQCSFVAYQDTLYVHSLRQFYRNCDVYGTVDFIFGNAAVVFQNCNLYARKPNDKQKNIFTAQGREDPNQNTGISILNCKVEAAADLIAVKSAVTTYLGRPWKKYSRTVVLLSYIGDLVDPAGWLEWNGTFALDTLYYGEYRNRGPGSDTTGRVTWPGYKVVTNTTEASQFTVGTFIQGNEWLNTTEVPFYDGLTS